MRARDLVQPVPTVGLDTPAVEAIRLLAGQDLPDLIVVDRRGGPLTVRADSQVLRLVVVGA